MKKFNFVLRLVALVLLSVWSILLFTLFYEGVRSGLSTFELVVAFVQLPVFGYNWYLVISDWSSGC